MKSLLLLFTALFFLACNSDSEKTISESSPAEPDSVRMKKIDEYINAYSRYDTSITQKSFRFPFRDTSANAYIYMKGDDMVRVAVSTVSQAMETRTIFFVKDDKVVHYNHREWFKKDNPRAKQVFAYFNNDKIFLVQERDISLQERENPSIVMQLPLNESTMDKDSLAQVILTEFKTIIKAGEANK